MPLINGGKPMPPRGPLPTLKDVVAVHDEAPGQMAGFAPVMCVAFSTGRYVFLVDRPRTVRFRGRQFQIYKNAEREKTPLKVVGLDGKAKGRSWEVSRPGFASEEFSFDALSAGFYALEIPCGKNRFVLEAADSPLAIDLSRRDCQIAAVNGNPLALTFEVPPKRGFALLMVGDSYHHFSATVRDPGGRRRFANELVDKVVAYSEDSVESPGFWTLEFAKAEKPCYDVIGLDLTGITGTLFLSHRKTWSCVREVLQ